MIYALSDGNAGRGNEGKAGSGMGSDGIGSGGSPGMMVTAGAATTDTAKRTRAAKLVKDFIAAER